MSFGEGLGGRHGKGGLTLFKVGAVPIGIEWNRADLKTYIGVKIDHFIENWRLGMIRAD